MKPMNQSTFIDFPKCPEGQFVARLVGIFDMGTQRQEFQGAVKMMPKVYLQFEVYAEDEKGDAVTDDEGKPFLVGIEFTASMSAKSNLLPFINKWRGKPLEDADFPFDFSRMLGQYGLMSVAHKEGKEGKVFAIINGIVPVPRQMAKDSEGKSLLPPGLVTPEFFDLDDQDWAHAQDIFDRRLWEKMKGRIQASPEYQARVGGGAKPASSGHLPASEYSDDDIPF